jgi:uncharacterized protein (TIGR02996 family)
MSEDQAFLEAVLAQPDDDAVRLVYADWLEERGDPRSDYLRLELELVREPSGAEAPGLRVRLQELRPRLDPLWLAHLDQPAVMRANPTPFPAAWWSIDLGPDREVKGTYGEFPYETLPPLPVAELRGDFAWLLRSEPEEEVLEPRLNVGPLLAAASALSLPLPREFLRFMGDSDLQRRVRSCTDCFFNLPWRVVPSPMKDGGYLFRFYSDSQSCLHWYLYATPWRYHAVVSSGLYLGGEADGQGEDDDDEWEESGESPFWFCAPSFETFLFRWWLENEIWHALEWDHTPLTPLQQAYLEHYRKG